VELTPDQKSVVGTAQLLWPHMREHADEDEITANTLVHHMCFGLTLLINKDLAWTSYVFCGSLPVQY
jgi:hypothetical protein